MGILGTTRIIDRDRVPLVANIIRPLLHPSKAAERATAVFAARNPKQILMLLTAQHEPLLGRPILERKQTEKLHARSNTDLAVDRPAFPDLTGVPEDLQDLLSPTLRMLSALSPLNRSHPSHGTRELQIVKRRQKTLVPEEIRTSVEVGPIDTGYELHRSLDRWLLEQIYPKENANRIHIELGKIADEVAKRPFGEKEKDVGDIRFLGFGTEEEFRTNTTNHLLLEMEKAGCDVQKVQDFLTYASDSDGWREETKPGSSKRGTGESYFAHYLTASWFLWNIIAPEVKAGRISPQEATELVSAAAIHDLQEDLNFHGQWTTKNSKPVYKMEVFSSAHAIEITPLMYSLLDAVTKKKGVEWLSNIVLIGQRHAPGDPDMAEKLTKFASLLKMSDRWANFLTLTAACDNYVDAMRKLEETKIAFARLSEIALLEGMNAEEIIAKLDELDETDNFEAALFGLPISAEVEQRVLESKFGKEVFDKVQEKAAGGEQWAVDMLQTISVGIAGTDETQFHPSQMWQDIEHINSYDPHREKTPWWQVRFDVLCDYYGVQPTVRQNSFPAINLQNHVGLEYFKNSRKYQALHHSDTQRSNETGSVDVTRPLSIDDVTAHMVKPNRQFLENFTFVGGIFPGHVDAFYMPYQLGRDVNRLIKDSKILRPLSIARQIEDIQKGMAE